MYEINLVYLTADGIFTDLSLINHIKILDIFPLFIFGFCDN